MRGNELSCDFCGRSQLTVDRWPLTIDHRQLGTSNAGGAWSMEYGGCRRINIYGVLSISACG